MPQAATKEHAHELIERMAPAQVPVAVELLEKMLDPVSLALANAPFEDELISEEEEQAAARARAEPGPGTTMEDLLAEYGLTQRSSSEWSYRLWESTARAMVRKKIVFRDQFKSDLRAIDRGIALNILRGLDRLSATGEGDVKRLQDVEPPEFRLRVGDYRVRYYDVGDSITVLAVRHRREAYR